MGKEQKAVGWRLTPGQLCDKPALALWDTLEEVAHVAVIRELV